MDQAVEQSAEQQIMALLEKEEPEEVKQEEVKSEPEAEAQPEAEAEAEEKVESRSIEIDPDEPLFEVKVKSAEGEKAEKLSLKELELGYMRTADYQRKTQEVARQREEVPEKIRQGIHEQLQKSVQEIGSLQALFVQTVAPELNGIDLNKLAVEDPAEYVRVSNRQRQIRETWQRMETAKQAKVRELTAQQQQQAKTFAEQAKEKIRSEIPNWNDELEKTLRDTAVKSYGFKAEELDSIHHPGFTKLLHDAHEFQKSQSATKTIADKKVLLKPKVLKPGTVKEDQGRERVTESFNKLQKSHRVEDAAATIFHMLK